MAASKSSISLAFDNFVVKIFDLEMLSQLILVMVLCAPSVSWWLAPIPRSNLNLASPDNPGWFCLELVVLVQFCTAVYWWWWWLAIFNLGWLHREVVDCWCLRCVVLLLCSLSNILYEKISEDRDRKGEGFF